MNTKNFKVSPAPSLHEEIGEPLPVKRGRRPPLDQDDWEPWLPPTHAYPEIAEALRVMVLSLLALLAFLTTAMFLMWVASVGGGS